ncbi:hypothetical protein LG634_13155 [Streptomyces bambusae]|uniref:hypothetical protein n=1 Tax=Streptomyces bambusae TaxID=1550616 RepID=UPI001CFE92ED|nr:hypothetical protein [Streptomyces bambusae]MCB5165781.1 hypothetical protein [Streptomyces bambusae]
MHRRNLALAALSGTLLLAAPGTAAAHGDTIAVTLTGQRQGHITADVTWENDGDPVEERVAATVNAVSGDGSRTAGPWKLVRIPGTAAGWTTAEALPAGRWQITVEVGFPDLGRGEGTVTVAAPAARPAPPAARAPGNAAEAKPAGPAGPAAPPAARPAMDPGTPDRDAVDDSGPGRATWFTTAGVAVAALGGAAVGILVRRRRRR